MRITRFGFLLLLSSLFGALLAAPSFGQAKPAASKPAASQHPRTSHMTDQQALLQPASLHEKAPDVYDAKFTTTKGDFVIRVTRAWAPQGADRFYSLVKHHYYDSASFFRVLAGFVVQFGISADPQISRAWRAATIKDDPVTQSNRRGFVTFATAGPNTRTTQVFINLGNNASLDGMGFSPFGQVTQGMDVVDQLYSGYGEGAPQGRGPDQGSIEAKGKTYLDQGFPKLDSIKTAAIVPAAAASSGGTTHSAPKP